MAYVPFPSAASRKAVGEGSSGAERGDAFDAYPTYRRVIRTVICGLLFAIPIGVAAPMSPLLKLSQTQDNKKAIVPRIMSDFFFLNFATSAASYWLLVEPYIPNAKGREGFVPYLGPVTAQVPAMSCLFTSHLFYPGVWALFNEQTWQMRRREFVRLNAKCCFAFGPVHVPAAVGLGLSVGLLMYPFKLMKGGSQRVTKPSTQ